MKPSILYTIGSWSGSRAEINFDDSYLEKHIERLKKVTHNLTQISIGNPDNPSKREEFEEYIKSLSAINGVPVVVHDMPNIGRSYGQWSAIYEKYRTQFDYYIFVEDDYQPMLDNFDSVLIEMYEKKNCGYLCGLVLDETGRYAENLHKRHAGVSNGIASSAALEKVRDIFGFLPHDLGEYSNGQVLFSRGFLEAGLTIEEYIDTGEYRTLFFNHRNIAIYGPNKDAKDIFSPAQIEKKLKHIHIKESDRSSNPPPRRPNSRVVGKRKHF